MSGVKGQHSAKGTKRHSLIRSQHNKATGKYKRQEVRTEARKSRIAQRLTCKLRRIDMRAQQDAEDVRGNRATGAQMRRHRKREKRERLRNYTPKQRREARERGQRQFAKQGGEA